ncbi:chemotaxis protein CheA [Methanosarcina hadiensis]|uniref:chemotaxis protein CheA n=1 Tax=Methanosarcina hadiensis TaxID=3078083 RepID=UPI0039772D2E
MDMSKYMSIFRSESDRNIKEMSDSLLALEKNPENAEQINMLFRIAHTFKGMAATMRFKEIVELTHEMESLIDKFRTGRLTPDPFLTDILFECLDALEGLVKNACADMETKTEERKNSTGEDSNFYPDSEKALKTLRTINNSLEESAPQENEFCIFSIDKRIEKTRENKEVEPEGEKKKGEREGKKKEVEEKEEETKQREWHKEGEIKQRDGKEREEKIEQREGEEREEKIEQREGEKKKKEEDGKEEKKGRVQSPKIQSSRISTEQLDKLMNLVGELVINRTRIKELIAESKSKDLDFALSEYQKLTRELQEEVLEIRMVPLDQITNMYPRMIRDLSKAQNKKIDFIIKGKEIKLDRTVMEEIGDPLVHLLRNAVDHGIETPEKRVEFGKEETGNITITASRQQNHILIKIEDDGRGIDPEIVRKAALEKGLICREEAEQLSEREAVQLIFTPGFSTASVVTSLSGRGVGMDIVKKRIERLGGSVRVESKPGAGSRFELKLPITIALYQAMLVKVGMERYAIPFTSIIKSISIRNKEVRRIRGEEVVIINEKALPLLRLRKLFQLPPLQNEESLVVVIVEKAGQYIGLVVDSLLGKQEVIIKNFKSRFLEKTRGFSGATIMGDGSVILILDVNSII